MVAGYKHLPLVMPHSAALSLPGRAESPPLSTWPVPRPRNWLDLVNQPQTEAELESLRLSVQRGRPFGNPAWNQRTAKRLGLEFTFRSRGRPREG